MPEPSFDPPASRWLRRLESFLTPRAGWWALGAVALAFVLRYQISPVLIFHPDEIMHILAAREPSLGDTYRSAQQHAHPPLFFLLLHLWNTASQSEATWRFLPVLFGAVFVWFLYRWVREAFGIAAGLFAAFLAAMLPFLVQTSAEVRGYSLLHVLLAAALAQAAGLFGDGRTRRLYLGAALMAAAVLTHYSAVLALPAFGAGTLVYALARRPGRRFWTHWALLHVALAGLVAILYVTHISHLRGTGMETSATTGWLRPHLYYPEAGSRAGFVLTKTWEIVADHYSLWPDRPAGFEVALGRKLILLGGVLAGLAILAAGHWRSAACWSAIAAAGAAYGSMAAASLLRVYPYGGTRHSSLLVLFSLALAGGLAGLLAFRRVTLALLLLLAPAWHYAGGLDRLRRPAAETTSVQLHRTLDQLRRAAPPGEWVVADHSTALLLAFYLQPRSTPIPWRRLRGGLLAAEAGPYHLVSSHPDRFVWRGRPDLFELTWRDVRDAASPPSRLWIAAAHPLGHALAAEGHRVSGIHSGGTFEFFRLDWKPDR